MIYGYLMCYLYKRTPEERTLTARYKSRDRMPSR